MKSWLGFLLAACISCSAGAQSLTKYAISNSGCSAFLYCDPGDIRHQISADTSEIYTAECTNGSTSYGLFCAKFASPIRNLQDAEDVLTDYMDYLKKSVFNITTSTGYVKGQRLNGREDTRGIMDSWQDGDKQGYKVKGWTNGKYLCVLYAYSKKEIAEADVKPFLDGIVFPGM